MRHGTIDQLIPDRTGAGRLRETAAPSPSLRWSATLASTIMAGPNGWVSGHGGDRVAHHALHVDRGLVGTQVQEHAAAGGSLDQGADRAATAGALVERTTCCGMLLHLGSD